MYIGSTGPRGLHHLVYEVVDNAVDEALAGYCDTIKVTIHPDNSISCEDNGRGIPVDKHPKEKIPTVEVVLTILHAGGKFGGEGYKVSGGLHGVGVSVVNALSTKVEVQVRRDGKEYEIDFDHGKTKTKLHEIGKAKHTGTTVTFWPDPDIFTETTVYDYDTLAARFREMAFLNRGLKIILTDERITDADGNPRTEVFQAMGGIVDFVKFLNDGKETLNKPIYFEAENADGTVEVALQWPSSYSTNSVMAFANNINTHEGGTHMDGFKQAITRTINDYARSKGLLKEKDPNLSGEDAREGLAAIISVKLHDPQFEGQTKTKLGNTEIRPLVQNAVDPGPRRIPGGEPHAGQAHHRQGHPGAEGPRGCSQGSRDDPSQERARLVQHAWQARRLRQQGRLPVRNLHRRGRFRRRFGQAGPRPQVPGHPASAR